MAPTLEAEPRILIVEENEYHGLLMGRQISQRVDRSQVMIARGADEALRLARIQNFDIAVVDFVLSDCDGLSLLHSLHQLDPDIAIIVVAEDISERVTKEVFKRGCEELLVKDSSYYAVIPRMVAGLLHRRKVGRHRSTRQDSKQRSERNPFPDRSEMKRQIQDGLDEIFRATKYILSLSEVEDNDLTEKVREIEEFAKDIRLSLEKKTRHVLSDGESERWPTLNGDKSAGYAVKSGH